jgi:hypothetical protein
MITKKVKQIYKCEYCPKWFQLEHRAVKHENKCGKNPANKIKCFDCNNFEQKFNDEAKKLLWYCNKYETFLSVKETENTKLVIRENNKNDCIKFDTKICKE